MTTQKKSKGILQPVNSERIGMRSAPVKPYAVKGDENAYLPADRKQKTISFKADDTLKSKLVVKLSKHDEGTQTDLEADVNDDDQLACDMVAKDEVSSEYWKILAERRREALAEALEENKKLHEENRQLREDNSSLLELASQAEYFANMLKEVTEQDEEATS